MGIYVLNIEYRLFDIGIMFVDVEICDWYLSIGFCFLGDGGGGGVNFIGILNLGLVGVIYLFIKRGVCVLIIFFMVIIFCLVVI